MDAVVTPRPLAPAARKRLCSGAFIARQPRKNLSMCLRIHRSLALLLVMVAPATVALGESPAKPTPTGEIVVRYIDGSVVKLTLLDDHVEIATAEGKRSIPVNEIRKVDLGLRISEEQSKQIEAAIVDLGS